MEIDLVSLERVGSGGGCQLGSPSLISSAVLSGTVTRCLSRSHQSLCLHMLIGETVQGIYYNIKWQV